MASQASLLLQKQLKGNTNNNVIPLFLLLFSIIIQFIDDVLIITVYFFFLFCVDLCKNPVDGFSAGLVDENNIFEWSVTVIGPPDTL